MCFSIGINTRRNIQVMLGALYMLAMFMALSSGYLASDGSRRKVNVELYISDQGRAAFDKKGKRIEDIVDDVVAKLEAKLNEQVAANRDMDQRPFEIEVFYPGILPAGVSLDECGPDTTGFIDDLNTFYNANSNTSVIAMYNCDSSVYSQEFRKAGQETPIIVHKLSTECSNRIATFVETEPMKAESILANALFSAAGSQLNNVISFEEVIDGKDGFEREIHITNEGFASINNACYVR
jgi:hypothetical protein